MGGLNTNTCSSYDGASGSEIGTGGKDINEFGQPIEFSTKHERIVHKIKKIKTKASVKKDYETASELEW